MKKKTHIVITFNDGEKHKLHPVTFRNTAEHFGADARAPFEVQAAALRKADPAIASIRRVGER